jgi:hypothetical protein
MEVLAPTIPLEEEFVWHWNQITDYYAINSECLKGPIEATNIGQHLDKMCQILIEEQLNDEQEGKLKKNSKYERKGSIGPSMEYLLQHKILDTMSVLAQTDSPFGMCPQILLFFTKLLSQSSLELVPHKCVYSSVQKLIIVCGKLIAGPYESNEVLFLTCISDQINRNPDLINCFLNDSFPLINALLALLQSPDSEISTKSGDALIRLVAVINERAAQIMTEETPFCSKIVHQLVTLYHAIPPSLKPQEIETAINTCFGSQVSSNAQTFESFSSAIRKFLCFLRWFVFFDMIIHHLSNETILMKTLLLQFRDDFLESCIVPDLTGFGYKDESDANDHIFLTTVLLANCLRNIASEQLATTIGEFLLIETKSETLLQTNNHYNRHNLKNVLLNRCLLIEPKSPESSHSDSNLLDKNKRIQLCMSSMQLFEEILNKPSVSILNDLVIQYLSDRRYFDKSVSDSDTYLDFNDFDDMRTQFTSYLTEDQEEVSIGSTPNSHHLSTSHVHRVLQYFTSLVPEELKSCQTNDEFGYETYVREAQKHYQECALICSNWKEWSNESLNRYSDDLQHQTSEDEIGSSNSEPEADISHKTFFEGPFLAMIFDNLQYMVQLPYEVNLQVRPH